MADRVELQAYLEKILGSENVYYQPPSNVKMEYPAIKYDLNDVYKSYAGDKVYRFRRQYQLIIIDRAPDHPVIDKLLQIPGCEFGRTYKADNLYHCVLTLYY